MLKYERKVEESTTRQVLKIVEREEEGIKEAPGPVKKKVHPLGLLSEHETRRLEEAKAALRDEIQMPKLPKDLKVKKEMKGRYPKHR